MTQTAVTVRPLKSRLESVYRGDMTDPHLPLRRITSHAGYAAAFPPMPGNVEALVVHETDGWPSRNKAENWVAAYTGTSTLGPQVAISGDGTVTPLVNLPGITAHASFVNKWALGCETGHRDGPGGYVLGKPPHQQSFSWHALSSSANDLVGRKYFVIQHEADNPFEVLAAWFPTSTYVGPNRDHPSIPAGMLFTEPEYRSWALLARYLAEAFVLPRNFPLLPHAQRGSTVTDAATFRRIVMADEGIDTIKATLVRELVTAAGANTFVDTDFVAGNEASFDANYQAAVAAANSTVAGWNLNHNAMMNDGHPGAATQPKLQERSVELNKAWLWFFKAYRGIHGHGFSGNIQQGFTAWSAAKSAYVAATYNDHDCPGPLFDWHRFAREVWDWWWYPFDLDAAHAHTNVPVRDYRAANGTTPLREYFFHEPVANITAKVSPAGGIQGATSSPSTFVLDADSPVYAVANGEIVAARFPQATAGVVDMGFVLVRHDVYHAPDLSALATLTSQLLGGPPLPIGAAPGRIDYDVEPTTVYSLTMHLARPADLTFTDTADANPEWLNRLIIRRKECDLAFPPPGNAMQAALAAMPAADFTRPPGGQSRPTMTEAWQLDQLWIGPFLDSLERGDLAISQSRQACEAIGEMPIQMILGDYLGRGGTIARDGAGALTKGVRVEVFSPQLLSPGFTAITDQTGWNVVGSPDHPALQYQSEWARTPDAAAVGSSRVDLQACKLEYSIVSPK